MGEYICSWRKSDGGLLHAKCYKNLRSSLSFLYSRYSRRQTEEDKEEMREILQGVSRTVASAEQQGEGVIEESKRDITLEIHKKIQQWFIEDGSLEAVFGRAYSNLTWNLDCRGDSTSSVCHKHLIWWTDSCGVPFAHEKNNQEGDSTKKRPRHIYANPFDPALDCILSLFEYLACFPEVLSNPDGKLFPGAEGSQTRRFGKILRRILTRHKDELDLLSYKVDEISIHSYRKGAATHMSSGTTAGPAGMAINIRGGWSTGNNVKDVYFLYEWAGDQYCGRILSGLNLLSHEFAASEPSFVAVQDGMSHTELERLQTDIDIKVNAGWEQLFAWHTNHN